MSNKNLIVNTPEPKPGILGEGRSLGYCGRNGNWIRNGNIDRTGDGSEAGIFRYGWHI